MIGRRGRVAQPDDRIVRIPRGDLARFIHDVEVKGRRADVPDCYGVAVYFAAVRHSAAVCGAVCAVLVLPAFCWGVAA